MKTNENSKCSSETTTNSIDYHNFSVRISANGDTQCMSLAMFADLGDYFLVRDILEEIVQSPTSTLIVGVTKNKTRYSIKVSPICPA